MLEDIHDMYVQFFANKASKILYGIFFLQTNLTIYTVRLKKLHLIEVCISIFLPMRKYKGYVSPG